MIRSSNSPDPVGAPPTTPQPSDKFAFLEASATPGGAAARQTSAGHKALHSTLTRLSRPTQSLTAATQAMERARAPLRFAKETFSLILLVLVLLAPLPVGLNRPLLWAIAATVMGAFGAVYMARMAFAGRPLAPQVRRFWPLFALAMAQPLWGLVQAQPLGGLAKALSLPVVLPQALHPGTISLDPNASLLGAMRLMGHIFFFLLALDLMDHPARVARAMRWLFWGIVGWAIYGMVALTVLGDIGLWGAKTHYQGFATGPFINRNSFAAFLGLGAVLGVARLFEIRANAKTRPAHRHGILTETGLRLLVHGAGLALIVITLLATGSRMGLAASALAMTVTALILQRAERPADTGAKTTRWPNWRIAALGLAGLVAVVVVFGQVVAERALYTGNDLATRLQIFAVAFDLIATRPFVGFGLDAFALAFELARPESFLNAFTFADAHSSYLENWAEGGLIFGSVPLVVGGLYARRLLRALSAGGRGQSATAAAAGALSLAGVHSLVDFPFEIEANLLLLCVICAIGVAPRAHAPAAPGKARA